MPGPSFDLDSTKPQLEHLGAGSVMSFPHHNRLFDERKTIIFGLRWQLPYRHILLGDTKPDSENNLFIAAPTPRKTDTWKRCKDTLYIFSSILMESGQHFWQAPLSITIITCLITAATATATGVTDRMSGWHHSPAVPWVITCILVLFSVGFLS